jgi:hypothetical protein
LTDDDEAQPAAMSAATKRCNNKIEVRDEFIFNKCYFCG